MGPHTSRYGNEEFTFNSLLITARGSGASLFPRYRRHELEPPSWTSAWMGSLCLLPFSKNKPWVCNSTNSSEVFYIASSASLKVESQGDNYKHLAKRRNTGHLFFCFKRSQLEFQFPLLNVTFLQHPGGRVGSHIIWGIKTLSRKGLLSKKTQKGPEIKGPSQAVWVSQSSRFLFRAEHLASLVALSKPF